MDRIKQTYLTYFRNKDFLSSLFLSIFIFAISLVVNFYAVQYATENASNPVTDVILSNIRAYDVDGIFIYGPLFLWVFVALISLAQPRRIPFILKNIGLFVLIRSLFITLTHIGPFPTQVAVPFTGFLGSIFSSGADLFFSAHTGLPFLLALIFWDNIRLRIFFIISSLIFGIVVLLGHLHYSIDVLSAFSITYTIYRIAEIAFPKDKKIFISGI